MADRQNSWQHLLSCSVCLEDFEKSGIHIPRLLPCTHTLCEGCIKLMIQDNKLECPECRRKHEAKNEEKSFPQNKYLLTQIRYKPKVPEKEPKPEVVPKCEEHGKELVLYCREEGCKIAVCPLCVANHLKHEIMDIETGMKEEIKEEMRYGFLKEVARVSTDLEDRLKQVSALKASVTKNTEKCLKNIEKKRAEINQELDNMMKEVRDLEDDTKLQIDENVSVINEKLLLLDNMKQTVEFGRDLSHQDLMNCREAVEDVAESNNRFLTETGSYMYPEFKATREPVGRISREEVTTSAPDDHPRSASPEEDEEQPMARRVTNASQLKCTGKHSRFMYLCRRQQHHYTSFREKSPDLYTATCSRSF